jgi:hypothetical protein
MGSVELLIVTFKKAAAILFVTVAGVVVTGNTVSSQENDEYISAMTEYDDLLIARNCGEPFMKTRAGVVIHATQCVNSKGGISARLTQNTDLFPGALGPQCAQSHPKTSRFALRREWLGS